jgi:micrococcal nuclease
MARILKFQQPRYRRSFRRSAMVRNRRWRQHSMAPVRPTAVAVLVTLVLLIATSVWHYGWPPGRVTGAEPLPPAAWMESAFAEPFVDTGWPVREPFTAVDGDPGAPLAELPTVQRGSAGTADASAMSASTVSAAFGFCHSGGGFNCVVDGDTFWFRGDKIRIADIDAPETHPARCASEASKGAAATRRLRALLNAGPFALEPLDRDTDRYGRQLRLVTRGGESIGGILVGEGLARWYGGGRQAWC